ncbi:hypothetical protein [Granulibacter bethesdensis]|uniref:hypothetical protein n=1 Tax=Granulibacter bethesdensis TaxID=364410 RepID=UPI0003F2046A|nr:hypothetical protein [Granulibacter bethesdensis]AHJ65252.1 Hypothetical protein GbCGDNIH4_5039 [Granulibacter bethesdensis CGDNIH4]
MIGMVNFPPRLTQEQSDELRRKRRGRNLAMLIVLFGMAFLFYAMAMVKIAHQTPHESGQVPAGMASPAG